MMPTAPPQAPPVDMASATPVAGAEKAKWGDEDMVAGLTAGMAGAEATVAGRGVPSTFMGKALLGGTTAAKFWR